jgi:hypothetical protein
MDFKKIKGVKHYLYDSIQEFYAHNENIVVRQNWRDGSEEDWIYTDDQYVCQILKVFKVGKNECVRTVCGTFSRNNKKRQMLGEDGVADHIYSFSGKYTTAEDKADNQRHFLFAKYIARGDDVIEAFRKAYPDAKSEEYIKSQTAKLLKKENVKKMIKEEIREILEEEGVTNNYLIGEYKTLADGGETDNTKLRALDSLAKISGLFDTQEKKTEELTVWAGFSPEQIEALKDKKELDNGKTQLLGKVTRESEEIQDD